MSTSTSKLRDSEGRPLIPGAMYCCFTEDYNGRTDYGALIWFSADGNFYDADDDSEQVYPDFDKLILQEGPHNIDHAQPE